MGFQNPEIGGMEFSEFFQSKLLSPDKILRMGGRKVYSAGAFFFVLSYDLSFPICRLPKLTIFEITRSYITGFGKFWQTWASDQKRLSPNLSGFSQHSVSRCPMTIAFWSPNVILSVPRLILRFLKHGKISASCPNLWLIFLHIFFTKFYPKFRTWGWNFSMLQKP